MTLNCDPSRTSTLKGGHTSQSRRKTASRLGQDVKPVCVCVCVCVYRTREGLPAVLGFRLASFSGRPTWQKVGHTVQHKACVLPGSTCFLYYILGFSFLFLLSILAVFFPRLSFFLLSNFLSPFCNRGE